MDAVVAREFSMSALIGDQHVVLCFYLVVCADVRESVFRTASCESEQTELDRNIVVDLFRRLPT